MKLLFCLLISFGAFAQEEKEIQIFSDTWCPYNCNPESSRRGFMVDSLESIFKSVGRVTYQEVGWSRALKLAQSGEADILIGSWDDESMKGLLKTEKPQGLNINCFYTNPRHLWTYEGVDSLKGQRLGVIQNYVYGEDLDKYISDPSKSATELVKLVGPDAVERSLEMLKANRLDVYLEDELVMKYHLAHSKDLVLRQAGCLAEKLPVHVVFAKTEKGKKLFEHFQKEWPRFESSEEFKVIKSFYLKN